MKRESKGMPLFRAVPAFASRAGRVQAMAALILGLAAGWADAQFVPGSGGSIPAIAPLEGIPGQIGGLKVDQIDRENDIWFGGTQASLDLSFPTPSAHEADGYMLQKSPDGGNTWEDLYATMTSSQDNFSFTPDGSHAYRLVVSGGPKHGQVSNVVFAPLSSVDTRFAGWGLDESMFISGVMAPWVGRGIQASFHVRKLEDDSEVVGGLTYQWYRVNPLTSEMTIINGATELSYITTEADVGGYHMICKATGDEASVGGYCQIGSSWPTLIPNNSFASNITTTGFRLNLFKSVPALAAEDLELSYWNGSETVYLPISSVTALEGNASFDLAVDMPTDATDLWLSNKSNVWAIGSEMFPGHFMQQLRIILKTEFDIWAESNPGIPADRRGRLDRNGPLNLQNQMAYAMGLDPITATAADLPAVNTPNHVAGSLHVIYRRAKFHYDVTLVPMISANLGTWENANVVSETVIEDGDDSQQVDALISFPPGAKCFIKFAAE